MGVAVCPMCHVANNESNRDCRECGYEFGQSLQTLRRMLKSQRRRSLSSFAFLLVLDVAILGAIVFLPLALVLLPFLLSVWGTYRAANKFFISRHSLKLVAAKEASLPQAKLLA